MIDGNGTAVSAESSDTIKRAVARASYDRAGFRAWHELEPEDRLALIESALRTAANDLAGELPIAL